MEIITLWHNFLDPKQVLLAILIKVSVPGKRSNIFEYIKNRKIILYTKRTQLQIGKKKLVLFLFFRTLLDRRFLGRGLRKGQGQSKKRGREEGGLVGLMSILHPKRRKESKNSMIKN